MKISAKTARKLKTRGNAAFAVAIALGGFLAVALVGSGGRWTTMHTQIAIGVTAAAAAALACWRIAGHGGDSPRVTHLPATPSPAAHEVRK